MKAGRPRRERIIELARPYAKGVVVDVGCDHGLVAAALGAIGSERRSNRLPRRTDIARVVADGLAPYRRVDLAIIAGMGPHTILHVLASGPRPAAAVVHSPDRTDSLRRGLKESGWRIDAEVLAPENRRYAEVIRVLPGEEPATGHLLLFGPRLLDDPLLDLHIASVRRHWARVASSAPEGSVGHTRAAEWLHFLDSELPGLR